MNIRHLMKRLFGHIDRPLAGLLGLLLLLSIVTVFSASNTSLDKLTDHLINISIALTAMVAISHVPPQRLMQFVLPAYILGVILLVGVAVAGEVVNGARRWLHIGVTRIQPSELMRLAVPMMVAWYLHYRQETLNTRHYATAAVLLLIPVGLILRQPDLGTALMISASGVYVLFLGGLSWRIIAGGIVMAGAALPFAWHFLHDYQRQRVLTLLDPSSDPLGAGYHIIQSTIAVGSGGMAGKGWLNGSQAHLDFLPERTTDFIFAVFSEEFGLLGNLILLLLYGAIIYRGLALAAVAPSLFGRLLAGSIVLTFFTYAFVNMGMVSGILPVVGVPLPLVSYGGTSMLSVLIGFGIVMSAASHKKLVKT
ncbi:cell elongation-specific peptidoglycan biosynthesis regulator RodA [Sulfuritortus calidifontis]|uniref:Peptidoglycan glycosyltransferase MrdB n=1 Tax=Sulfuritortus calidifontis TaxID=1914471 RepID=A0A4R3JYP8_9PROT|nr:rod shape-determining protein RodA [Sulfuritortus calidifontis]TCS72114.1 cell elongation-specific peptidoglycan biosynthesis regulator RodA [Sulfuritortus calidifontis]